MQFAAQIGAQIYAALFAPLWRQISAPLGGPRCALLCAPLGGPLCALLALPVAAGPVPSLSGSVPSTNPAPAATRTFEFRYEAEIRALPEGVARADLWLPLAQDDAHQRIRDVRIESPAPASVVYDERYGNAALRFAATGPLRVAVRYVVERVAESHSDLAARARPEIAPAGEAVGRWLRPDKLGGMTPAVLDFARRATAGRKTAFEKVRGIYDFVFDTMRYDKSGEGWGRGDIAWACDRKSGNCTDFHTLFVAMARSSGVPARFEIGFPLPPARGAGEVAGYHCWARFFLPGAGWAPVDISEASKHPERREAFFGGHDENRIQFTVGRDLRFPGMAGELNYFIYPYAESAGKPIEVARKFSYRDLP